MIKTFRLSLTILVLFFVIIIIPSVYPQKVETITERQRDTVLLMTARENPNYDICLVMDVSGSMKKIINNVKIKASRVIDFSSKGDTLILIKFDDSPRRELIQEIQDQRDLENFKSWIMKIKTTDRFGTDIQAAYFKALRILQSLNNARKSQGKPQRIQYIVFISDGDDIPPAQSPFRNKASKQSLELIKRITKANKNRLINIIPVGMSFKNYSPQFKRYSPDYKPTKKPISSPDIQNFVKQLQVVLHRQPSSLTGSENVKVPKAPYQFFIDQLSKKTVLEKISVTNGEEKHSKIFKFRLISKYKALKLDNLLVSAHFNQSLGNLKGKVNEIKTSSKSIEPGNSIDITISVLFPQNWSFKKVTNKGNLCLSIRGDMVLDLTKPLHSSIKPISQTPIPTLTSTPTVSKTLKNSKKIILPYPFNEITITDKIEFTIPPEKLLYYLLGLILLTIILLPTAFIYQVIVPITVTIKQGDKARAFNLANGGIITLGSVADFEIPGTSQVVAEIQRRFRRFVLHEKQEGVISKNNSGPVSLKLGDGFSLNINGTYMEFEFLPGNREYDDEANITENIEEIDEEPSEFRF